MKMTHKGIAAPPPPPIDPIMAITPNWRSSGNVSEMIITAEGYIGPRNIPMKENAIALRVRFGINQIVSWRARHIQVLLSAGGKRDTESTY
jgi:hypothetical protein